MRSVISFIVTLCAATLFASGAEADVFEFPKFVVASGMGQIDVLVPADANFSHNPALLPFSFEGNASCGGNPVKLTFNGSPVKLWTEYAALKLPLSTRKPSAAGPTTQWDLAAGFQRYSAAYEGLWNDLLYRYNIVTAAISRRGKFDLGLGVTGRIVRAVVTDLEFPSRPEIRSSGFSYDLGLFGRFPIFGRKPDGSQYRGVQLQLVSGLALTEAGKPWEVGYILEEQPHAWRAGLGLESNSKYFRILACSELLVWLADRTVSDMYGGEIEWRQALTIRAGYSQLNDNQIGYSSVGLTISSRGLLAFVSDQRIQMPFDVRGYFAHINSWPSQLLNGNQWGLQFEI